MSATKSTSTFKARMSGPTAIMKVADEDRFIIWGKASVEVVDKEGDKITAEALKEALPQLLRRSRLSLEHSDQLVGDILESFETDEEVTVEIDGETYERSEFPTDVLKLDEDEPPALFVAGEIYDDTRQAKQVRDEIEAGTIDSYSISGEAITTSTKVKDGEAYDEITDLDLSAVTLCEEGMNHKAKFGTVVKRIGDDSVSPVNLGRTSSPRSAVKSDTHNMAEDTTNESDDDGDLLKQEELRGEFKKAAAEALEESDFVTADKVKEIVDSRLDKEEGEDDEPTNASDEAGDDMEEQKSEEADEEKAEDADEKAEDGEDAEKEGDHAYPDDDEEDEKAVTEDDAIQAAQTIEAFLEAADDDAMDPDDDEETETDVDPDEIEDPDDDNEEEVDLDPTEDEEMPPEEGDDEEEKGDLMSQLESEGVPDDLCDAVSEYVEGGDEEAMEAPDEEPEDEVVEANDEGDMDAAEKQKSNTPIGGDDLDDLSDVSSDADYLDMTASAAVPETDEDKDMMKSFEHTDNDVDSAPGTLDALYESMGEDI